MIRWLKQKTRILRSRMRSPLLWAGVPGVSAICYAMWKRPSPYADGLLVLVLFGLWTLTCFLGGVAVGASLVWRKQNSEPPVQMSGEMDYDSIIERLWDQEQKDENAERQQDVLAVGYDY